jgi:inner membrane protein
VEAWIWIVTGIVLIILEIIIPSFTIIWFGMAAVVVGLITLLSGALSLPVQLALWAILSCAFTYGWFRFFRQETKTLAGQSKDAIIGKAGVVVRVTDATFPGGVIRFPIAVLGSDEWSYIADEQLQVGDRGVIVDIAGDKLLIKKG